MRQPLKPYMFKAEEDSETPDMRGCAGDPGGGSDGIRAEEKIVSSDGADAHISEQGKSGKRELEEKIEDGEVMMLSGAENTFRARETVHLEFQ